MSQDQLAEPIPQWHVLDHAQVALLLATSTHGLSSSEVQARQERYGPNELEVAPPPSNLLVLLHQFQSPLIYILLAATAVTLALGEFIDAAVIGAVLVLNAVIGFFQERKAEASVRALMQLMTPQARVLREGREWQVESRELAPGDVVLLESGLRVPADLRLVSATNLSIDESLLTGESLPVLKHTEPLPDSAISLADRTNMAFSGTVVARGRGTGYVVATGRRTELGAVAEHVREAVSPKTPLQRRMAQFAAVIAVLVGVASVAAFSIGLLTGQRPVDMLMAAVAMAVAAVPEGLPIVFTITLAIGVRRMAQRNVIIRRLPAVETLGSTTVIGSDKTGTLTQNRMTVQEVWAGGRTFVTSGPDEAIIHSVEYLDAEAIGEHRALFLTLLAGVLTNEASLLRTEQGLETHGDPTEAAILIAAADAGLEPESVRERYRSLRELPFEPEHGFSASFREHEGEVLTFVKGSPERVLSMCDRILMDGEEVPLDREAALGRVQFMASRALRVLGMAYGRLPGPPREEHAPNLSGLTFLGIQGMLDPPRPGVREAIEGCHEAGMHVMMITGDHPDTAKAIARALGIARDGAPVLTGAELELMDDTELVRLVREVALYARVAPEHKLRVVRALQALGEIVAVTGDGVNDAPALRAADIGISMGRSGTDVAREASDMVLADDNFVSIYTAVEQGRITFDNLRKATFFLVSTGVATIITVLVSLLVQWPLPFLPAQLLWLNLVTSGLQDVALAFEPGERSVLRQPPRRRGEGILSSLLWERTGLTGLVMAAGTLFLFRWELDTTGSLTQAQTMALTTMVVFQMLHVGNARSHERSVFRVNPFSNRFLFVAVVAALAVHVAALYLPPTQFVLRVEPITLEAWGRIVVVGFSVIVTVELHKLVRHGINRRDAA